MLIPLTRNQIQLVQKSWKVVEQQPDEFAEIFYKNLFSINPDLQKLFKRSMKMQGRKLVSMFSTAVNCLGNLDDMKQPLEAAGERHVQYEVKSEQYEDVNSACLSTLEEMFGDQLTVDTKEAWLAMLKLVSAIMGPSTDSKWSDRLAS